MLGLRAPTLPRSTVSLTFLMGAQLATGFLFEAVDFMSSGEMGAIDLFLVFRLDRIDPAKMLGRKTLMRSFLNLRATSVFTRHSNLNGEL